MLMISLFRSIEQTQDPKHEQNNNSDWDQPHESHTEKAKWMHKTETAHHTRSKWVIKAIHAETGHKP
jgi:hypothetical protein